MAPSAPLQRPELTLPAAEAAAYAEAVASASVVLEFGSGGSTVLAAEAGAEVWSVESDRGWALAMQAYFAAHPSPRSVTIHYADIGPTKKWGRPVDESAIARWPDYPQGIWGLMGDSHPDLVLIDGRFRLACFMTVAHRISRPVRLFFDDYEPRKTYHAAAEISEPLRMIGRMAEFYLTPTQLTPDRMPAYERALLQPV